MSAVVDSSDGPTETIKVLITLHPGFDLLDAVCPLEVLTYAQHNIKDPGQSCLNFIHFSVPMIDMWNISNQSFRV